jgi:hypothetical protein
LEFLEKLMSIDRRVIFVFVGIALVVPFFLDIGQKIEISPEVQTLYDAFMELPPGSKVLMSFDYDPPSAPELQPQAITALRLCFDRNLKVIMIGLWPMGPMQANLALETIFSEKKYLDKEPIYGVDYVNLGYSPGNELVIQRMGSSIPATFPRDFRGTPIQEIPLMQGIVNFSNVDYVFNLSAGYPGTVEWVQFAVDRFHARMGAANTAVQAPLVYPYVHAGQLTGLSGGMKGAAEFEKLTGFIGKGTKFMLSQSFAHLIVILFIIIGNTAYFITRARKKEKTG